MQSEFQLGSGVPTSSPLMECDQGGRDDVISISAASEAEAQQQEGGESNSHPQGHVRL